MSSACGQNLLKRLRSFVIERVGGRQLRPSATARTDHYQWRVENLKIVAPPPRCVLWQAWDQSKLRGLGGQQMMEYIVQLAERISRFQVYWEKNAAPSWSG